MKLMDIRNCTTNDKLVIRLQAEKSVLHIATHMYVFSCQQPYGFDVVSRAFSAQLPMTYKHLNRRCYFGGL